MFRKFIGILLLTLGLSSCISTDVKESSDPSYVSFRASKILFIPPTPEFTQIFLSAIRNKDVAVQVVSFSELFGPTQSFTKDEMLQQVKRHNVDGILAIKMDNGVVEEDITTLSDPRRSTFSVAYGEGVDENTPVLNYTRDTSSSAELIDPMTGKRVWQAQLKTMAEGIFSIQDDDAMESISQAIIDNLLKKGFFVTEN